MELNLNTRKDCFNYLKNHRVLSEKILIETGWHYTNVKTEVLKAFILKDYNRFINKLFRFLFRK